MGSNLKQISYLLHRIVAHVIIPSVLILLFWLYKVTVSIPSPVITTLSGKVQGGTAYSREGRAYWQFVGIPYAKPPVGHLKFQPPEPVDPWVDIKSATNGPPFCIQYDALITQMVFGQEDCLYLNVYTHPFNQSESPKRPVLVHIHGGGFMLGSSYIYGPEYLMDHSMVVVTFNYRLGPFGFLNFEHDPNIDGIQLPRGNMGMKDQLLVLKWVQNNIARFGGDPNQVTLFGGSAGGVATQLHVLSPKSKGLFHRAYSHSGVSLCTWSFTQKPRETALSYAKKWNCPINDTRELLNCLENMDPREMVRYQLSAVDPAVPKDHLSPSVESVKSDDTFLEQHPLDIMASGNFSRVPYILAVNSGDGSLRTARFDGLPSRVKILQDNWADQLKNVLLVHEFPEMVAMRAKNFYFSNKEEYQDRERFKNKLTTMISDFVFFEPVQRVARWHAKSGADTHLIYYNYTPYALPSSFSVLRAYNPENWFHNFVQVAWQVATDMVEEHLLGGKGGHLHGICHGEDIVQTWNFVFSKWLMGYDKDFSKDFVKMIAEFVEAKFTPKFRGTELPKLGTVGVNVSDANPILYMLIDDSKKGKIISEPFEERMKFWKSNKLESMDRQK